MIIAAVVDLRHPIKQFHFVLTFARLSFISLDTAKVVLQIFGMNSAFVADVVYILRNIA